MISDVFFVLFFGRRGIEIVLFFNGNVDVAINVLRRERLLRRAIGDGSEGALLALDCVGGVVAAMRRVLRPHIGGIAMWEGFFRIRVEKFEELVDSHGLGVAYEDIAEDSWALEGGSTEDRCGGRTSVVGPA